MAVSDKIECKTCENCGKEIAEDLEVFCHMSQKKAGEDICWCICGECKVKFLEHVGPKRK